MPSASAIGKTAIVLIFAFVGLEVALVPSGEVRDPARTVPRALFSALAITTTLYLLIQTVAQGLLGPSMSAFAAAPLAEAAGRVLGRSGRLLVLLGAVVSMFGYTSGDMLGTPRTLFAFARDGVLPSALARVHPRFHTPYIAIVVHACIVATVSISSSFTQLAVLANVAALTLYLMCVGGVLRAAAARRPGGRRRTVCRARRSGDSDPRRRRHRLAAVERDAARVRRRGAGARCRRRCSI